MHHHRSAVLAAAVLVATGHAFAETATPSYPNGLRPPLEDVVRSASPSQLVPISIVLREQASVDRLRAVGLGLDRHAARRARLGVLKEMAGRTQAPLLALLGELERRGSVARIRPLWIGNVVGVDATPEVVRALAARPEVAWVNYNPKTDVSLGTFTPAPPKELDRLILPPRIETNE